MKYLFRCAPAVFAFVCFLLAGPAAAQTVVFEEHSFPTVDTAPVSSVLLHRAFPAAKFASETQLAAALADPQTIVLVLPYGSAFPRERWVDIQRFLLRGGNLLTLGGRPFTRPLVRLGKTWQLQPETYAYVRQLLISDYQATAGSDGASVTEAAEGEGSGFVAMRWQRAYSVTIRLGQTETAKRVGASGSFDAVLKPLVWGVFHGRTLSAPVIEIDHLQNDYAGGRWIMANCAFDPAFLASPAAAALLETLAVQAALGAELVRALPSYPLYLPGEKWQLALEWTSLQQRRKLSKIDVAVFQDGQREAERSIVLPSPLAQVGQTFSLPGSGKPGYHTVDVRLTCGDHSCGVAHTAFWVRDRAWLASGPKLDVDRNFFRIDGKPASVVGTTYMASDAQRLFFRYPNPYVWNRDMAQISAGGLNMLRTGIWTDWDQVADADGTVRERALRTIEAYLMTARRYRLPVQFTLFAFMPEVFGGINPYLDPEGLRHQHKFVASLAQSFADVPFLAWDLINEPSFDNPAHFFTTMANGDAAESKAWNAWLLRRYGSREAVARAWSAVLPDGPIPVPGEADATAQSANDGGRPLAVTDFGLFAQESFAGWARDMRAAIRAAGSRQPITVGQDEGGALISPSPNYFKEAVDFTTVHSWWFNDDLLWDSLSAKLPGVPMLVQETGVMPETNADARPRRTPEQDAALLERKIGTALATGAGAIEWLWNVNALMRSQQEVTIGALRPDGTEKPDAAVLRAYGVFAKALTSRLGDPVPEPVAILTSQAAQFSVLQAVATDAQHRAVRVMNYQCRTPARLVGENRVGDIAGAKLVVLPSALMLRQETWQALLQYVGGGGTLLLTGSAERDEHWQPRDRLKALGLDGTPATLTYRSIDIDLGGQKQAATFSNIGQRALETLRLPGGRSFAEVEYGKGRILVVAAPVELAESPDVTAAVYRYALQRAGVVPAFEAVEVPASVLVRPVFFANATLYLFASEDAAGRDIVVRDGASGTVLRLNLPAERTKMLLVDRPSGAIVAAYDGSVSEN